MDNFIYVMQTGDGFSVPFVDLPASPQTLADFLRQKLRILPGCGQWDVWMSDVFKEI